MINSRKIEDLNETVAAKCKQLIHECDMQGIDLIVTSTYRDFESQEKLYAQGRTDPGAIVTKARGGDSIHNYRMAFDVVPVVGGKAVWNDNVLWRKIGKIGTDIGLEWGGSWTNFKDFPHFQDTGGLTLAQLRNKYPKGL